MDRVDLSLHRYKELEQAELAYQSIKNLQQKESTLFNSIEALEEEVSRLIKSKKETEKELSLLYEKGKRTALEMPSTILIVKDLYHKKYRVQPETLEIKDGVSFDMVIEVLEKHNKEELETYINSKTKTKFAASIIISAIIGLAVGVFIL